jgi:ABC-2 type transport system permease protein
MNSPAADSPAESGVATHNRSANVLLTLTRRELWEHRALWLAPLVVAGLLLIFAVPSHMHFGMNMHTTQSSLDPEHRAAIFALAQWGLTAPQYLVMVVVLYFYLLDCLYAERKDRSILFWKSLPVSDAATVGSKLFVALVVVPLGVFVVALVTNLLFTAIWNVRASVGGASAGLLLWDTAAWLKVQVLMLLGLVISILWYAPIAAYLVLVSASSRRNVFLWAALPPLLAVIVERVAFGTHYVSGLLQYRVSGIWRSLHIGHLSDPAASLTRIFDAIDLQAVFTNIDLWLGLIVAGAFAFAAVRIRRYRDDT